MRSELKTTTYINLIVTVTERLNIRDMPQTKANFMKKEKFWKNKKRKTSMIFFQMNAMIFVISWWEWIFPWSFM